MCVFIKKSSEQKVLSSQTIIFMISTSLGCVSARLEQHLLCHVASDGMQKFPNYFPAN